MDEGDCALRKSAFRTKQIDLPCLKASFYSLAQRPYRVSAGLKQCRRVYAVRDLCIEERVPPPASSGCGRSAGRPYAEVLRSL
jgi:hypothetical protein